MADPTPSQDVSSPLSTSADSTGSAVIDSLLHPGLNKPMQLAMNASFAGLVLVLGAMALLTRGDLHVIFVIVTTLALWGSINWFLSEIAKLPPSVKEVQQMPVGAEAGAEGDKGGEKTAVEGKKDQ